VAPVTVEAYPVGLKRFRGELHAAPTAVLPTFGPANNPVVDTALAVRLPTVTPGPFMTIAENCVMLANSTNTVCPFSTDKMPVKPESKKPSLIVGSGPEYVNVAILPDPREYPVMLRVVA